MTQERIVPLGGLVFVLAAALMLATLIARNPNTHGHLWQSVPAGYERTPLVGIGEADLPAILADVPPFVYPAPPGAAPAAQAGAPGGEVQRVTLREGDFEIAPDRVTVQAGAPVELAVVNEGKQVHGIWLPDFGISEDIRSGKTQVFRFTPEKPGRFRYTCSYNLCGTEEEHARMLGFLTVQ